VNKNDSMIPLKSQILFKNF